MIEFTKTLIMKTTYSSNISNSQWKIISKFLDTKRNRKHDLREVVNAILYLVKTGCQWRLLPSDFPNWRVIYYYFATWKQKGLWKQIHDRFVEKIREKMGKKQQPTAGVIDAQTVKGTLVSGQSRGYDAGKKIKGIKRHLIVDTLGLVLSVVIQSASVQDRDGASAVLASLVLKWTCIIKIFGDGGYSGQLIKNVQEHYKIVLEIVKRCELHTFKILPKRWIVERTFAWLDTNRRNSKFYERLDDSGVAMVHIASIRLMLNRL